MSLIERLSHARVLEGVRVGAGVEGLGTRPTPVSPVVSVDPVVSARGESGFMVEELDGAGCSGVLGGDFSSLETPGFGALSRAVVHLGAGVGHNPVFIDTETTGLAGGGVVAFLIGLAWHDGAQLRLRQWTLTKLGAEPAMLASMLAALAELGPSPLVSYNGSTFDLPLLRLRAQRYRMAAPELEADHLDLLHVARRMWGGRAPDCKLGTLERLALGVTRRADIASAEIPEVFWSRLQAPTCDRSEARLRAVIDHNQADLVSLPSLAMSLAADIATPRDLDQTRRAARHLSRLGLAEEARACLARGVEPEIAARPCRVPVGMLRDAALELAVMHRRAGERDRAAPLWRWAWAADPRHPVAAEAWAKHLEHHCRDFEGALRVVEGSRLPCPQRVARLRRRAGGATETYRAPGTAGVQRLAADKKSCVRRREGEHHGLPVAPSSIDGPARGAAEARAEMTPGRGEGGRGESSRVGPRAMSEWGTMDSARRGRAEGPELPPLPSSLAFAPWRASSLGNTAESTASSSRPPAETSPGVARRAPIILESPRPSLDDGDRVRYRLFV